MEEKKMIDVHSRRKAISKLIGHIVEYGIYKEFKELDLNDSVLCIWKKGEKYEILAEIKLESSDEEFAESYNNAVESINKLENVKFCGYRIYIKTETRTTIDVPGLENSIIVNN